MTLDARLLRALLGFAQARTPADDDALALRLRIQPFEVRRATRRLQAAGFLRREQSSCSRLTMAGLALAVALSPRPVRHERPGERRAAA